MNILDYKYKLLGRVYRAEGGGGEGGGGSETGGGANAPDTGGNIGGTTGIGGDTGLPSADAAVAAGLAQAQAEAQAQADARAFEQAMAEGQAKSEAYARESAAAKERSDALMAEISAQEKALDAALGRETTSAGTLGSVASAVADQPTASVEAPAPAPAPAVDSGLASLTSGKPGETSMAQTASETGGRNLSTAALEGTLDSNNLSTSDLAALEAMGLGSLTGVNKANPEQTVAELSNSFAFNDFVTANMPSAATLASMVAGPVAGLVVNAAMSIAEGKSVSGVIGNIAGSILGQAITAVTGVPVSLDTISSVVNGQFGQAALSVAFNSVANATGFSPAQVQSALTGNLGAAVQSTVTGALTNSMAKALGTDTRTMEVIGQLTGATKATGTNVAGFVNSIAGPLNSLTSDISQSIASIGVSTGVNNLAGQVAQGNVNTTPTSEVGNGLDEYLRTKAVNSGVSVAQGQTNARSTASSGGFKVNWNNVFGEVAPANERLPASSAPIPSGTAGTTGAMQGGFGAGTDITDTLTKTGLQETTPSPVDGIPGQMQTGLQGLIGGLQQQATQMAAPGVVETVKATPGFSFDSPLNVGFFGGYESQKAPTKDKESLKIATGGYLDDLLEAIR